jgi:hypothetical protein
MASTHSTYTARFCACCSAAEPDAFAHQTDYSGIVHLRVTEVTGVVCHGDAAFVAGNSGVDLTTKDVVDEQLLNANVQAFFTLKGFEAIILSCYRRIEADEPAEVEEVDVQSLVCNAGTRLFGDVKLYTGGGSHCDFPFETAGFVKGEVLVYAADP